MIQIEVAVAKTSKHRSGESGDTVEMIERPAGGFAFVLSDGQGSGRGAKTLSNLVVTRAIGMLKDGMAEEAVAQEVNSYLYNYRQGQVGVSLDMLSVDLASSQLRLVRNNPCPFYVLDAQGLRGFSESIADPIGLQVPTRSQVVSLPIRANTYVLLFTRGLLACGARFGEDMALDNYLGGWPAVAGRPPEELVEDLLRRAIELDRGQPADDLTILALAALPGNDERVRRLKVRFPLEPA
jgi:serine phosphatase RsbU (regulator of sigma subunit)